MIKEKLKKIIKTLIFLGCFLVLFYLVDSVLKFKYEDGVRTIDNFYDLPKDTVDVLLLGSSHMGMNVDPSILWEEQGIAAYNCWGSVQPTWNTYHYLKECLKYQTPKLVVMDAHMATSSIEYSAYETAVKSTIGMRMSKEKWASVDASLEPEYRSSILLGLPAYHYRYSELAIEDFQDFLWNKKTEIQRVPSSRDAVMPVHIVDYSDMTEAEELGEKTRNYFIKIIDLCEERKIPFLLVASPYEMPEMEAKRFNKVEEIAESRRVTFLNFTNNYKVIGLNTETDWQDPAHFTDSGIQKYTSYLATYLKQNYELPDRRLDEGHIWNIKADVDENCIYRMEEQFIGGGLEYLDTGVKLYENPFGSYTLLTQIDTRCMSEDKVWLSCFSEENNHYRGLLVRKEENTIYVRFSGSSDVKIRDYADVMNLAIVKKGLDYKVFNDGEVAGEITLSSLDAYDETLLLGCQLNEEGKRFRYSDTTVKNLEIYDIALDDQAIKEWDPKELPMPEAYQASGADSDAEFELNQQFIGNGYDKYLDTGLALYEDAEASWTLLSKFSETSGSGSGVYLSCFNEEESNYHGLLVRRTDPGTINIMYGNYSENVQVDEGGEVSLAITKEKFKYNLYVNGECIIKDELVETDSYAGNLLVGCQETPDGEKMRFSEVTVYNLEVYEGIMDSEDILEWDPEHKEAPPKKKASEVNYKLSESFMGDGKSEYVDTGMQLYDTADKSWTLEMKFRKNGEGSQTLATCFAEDPRSYRGLIITLLDDLTLSLTLGQTSVEVELPPQPEIELKIIKNEYDYTIYINGEKLDDTVYSKAAPYDGTLHLGCAVDAEGKEFRFSEAMILEFTVTDSVNVQ